MKATSATLHVRRRTLRQKLLGLSSCETPLGTEHLQKGGRQKVKRNARIAGSVTRGSGRIPIGGEPRKRQG